jgi:hypothetical protein
LRTRLKQRRDLVAERLQLEADRVARERHAARAETAREQVVQLERRREELVTQLMAKLEHARKLDAAARNYDSLLAKVERRDAEIAEITEQLRSLEAKLAETQPEGADPDRASVGEISVARVSQGRYRSASLVAGGACVATWLICAMMIVRTPRRRGASSQILELPPTTGE